MTDKLQILFEKYKFDYLYINPKNIEDLKFIFIPDETIIDFKGKPYYLGKITIDNNLIEVYHDKKITPGDVIFKYKNIKKERIVKLEQLLKN